MTTERNPNAYQCPECGYQTVSSTGRTCPECGHCGDWVQPGESTPYRSAYVSKYKADSDLK